MRRLFLPIALLAMLASSAAETVTVIGGGRPALDIAVAADAAPPERYAAELLAATLGEVAGAPFRVIEIDADPAAPVIAVGPGAARLVHPGVDLAGLGTEGILLESSGGSLIRTGGNATERGTIYAASTFLEEHADCFFPAPGVKSIPRLAELAATVETLRYVPPFWYREPFFYKIARSPDWAAWNKVNGHTVRGLAEPRYGGIVNFIGGDYFAHTFEKIAPRDEYFAEHPEWFSENNGVRAGPGQGWQWCLTNEELLAFCIAWVKDFLKDKPADSILSISQIDGDTGTYRCRCVKCAAVEAEEGAASGPYLRFVNAVAAAIEADYPEAMIETLAYGPTTAPPKLTRARHNVVIRYCGGPSEECAEWGKICDNLFAWNYVTNFYDYVLPVAGFDGFTAHYAGFRDCNVKGVFSLGNYNRPFGSFADLRAFLAARLMWEPERDPHELARRFVRAYYGEAAAPYIAEYLELLYREEAERPGAACFSVATLQTADRLLAEAEAKSSGEFRDRVAEVRFGVIDAIMTQMPFLRQLAELEGIRDGFAPPEHYVELYRRYADQFELTHYGERPHETIAHQLARYDGRAAAPHPEIVAGLPRRDWFEFQDDRYLIIGLGDLGDIVDDPPASDGKAAMLNGTHTSLALRPELIHRVPEFNPNPDDLWDVYFALRIELRDGATPDGSAVVYGCNRRTPDTYLEENTGVIPLGAVSDREYRWFKMAKPQKFQDDRYLWFAPPRGQSNLKGIFIDRVVFVRRTGAGA